MHSSDQPRAEAEPARPRLDDQQPQLGDVVALAHAEHRAGRGAVELGDPRGLACRVLRLGEAGDDPGHEDLEAAVPAVLVRVQPPVALDDPAEVAGARRAEDDGGRCRRVEQPPHLAQRGREPVAVDPVEPRLRLLGRAPVEDRERLAARRRQAHDLAPPVGRRALAGDQAAPLQPPEQAAQVARVDPHPRPQVGDLDALLLGELEQHAALGERVRRVEQTGAEQLQLGRVEAAEGPQLGDRVRHR